MQGEILDIRDALTSDDEQCRSLKASIKDTEAASHLNGKMRKIHDSVVSAMNQRAHAEADMKEIHTLIKETFLARQEADVKTIRTCIDDAMRI